MLVVPLARFIVVPPLVLIANTFRGRKRSLSCNEIVFLIFAGLRGAIAYALARSSASPHQRTIVAATTAVVLFTTFVLGGTTRLMLRTLGMIAQDGADDKPAAAAGVATPPSSDGFGGLDLSSTRGDGGGLALRFQQLDARYLQPLFGGPGQAHDSPTTTAGGRRSRSKVNSKREIELEPITAERDTNDASGDDH